jgi:uncharacterized protein involved in response to NO
MSLASLFILMGATSWNKSELLVGVALAVVGFLLACYVGWRRWSDRPDVLLKAMLGLAAFYVACAVAAAVADPAYVIAALGAALIPLAALALTLALLRVVSDDGDGATTRR